MAARGSATHARRWCLVPDRLAEIESSQGHVSLVTVAYEFVPWLIDEVKRLRADVEMYEQASRPTIYLQRADEVLRLRAVLSALCDATQPRGFGVLRYFDADAIDSARAAAAVSLLQGEPKA